MFLPVVLPPLLKALEVEVKFSMEAADPDEGGQVWGLLAVNLSTASTAFWFLGGPFMIFD